MTVATRPRPVAVADAVAVPTPERSLALEIAAFAALAGFAAGHWAGMVNHPPTARLMVVVAVCLTGALALGLLGRGRLTGSARTGLAALAAFATVAVGLVVAGLPARLLLPGHFGALHDLLDRGINGVYSIDWPYTGGDHAIRLTILMGLPLLLGVGTTLAFWPARRAAPALRIAGLALVLVAYGTAVAEHDPGAPLLRGLVLLVLVAAWLWLPRLTPREAGAGLGAVAVAGLLALPLAGRLDSSQPWWDYRSWSPLGQSGGISFNWEHTYGPLNWSRKGRTLLDVRTDRPVYLRAETLDSFDGLRWVRSQDNPPGAPATAELPRLDRRWERHLRITVRALRSDFLVAAGTPVSITGAGSVSTAADGTVSNLERPLRRGESYSVRAYVPDPSPAEMRAARPSQEELSGTSYVGIASQYTRIALPRRRQSALRPGRDGAPAAVVTPAPWGLGSTQPQLAAPGASVARSPYAGLYRLSRRLTARASSEYDAVRAVERHLERNYQYSESPPVRAYPLEAFLFQDKIGYCQQFSGAMALMLRTVGIPARVVSGFSPGAPAGGRGQYEVRDLDAHSWVEVYFPGLGWVTFDPTPSVAPARSQLPALDLGGKGGKPAGPVRSDRGGTAAPAKDWDGSLGSASKGEPLRPWMAVLTLMLLALAAGAAALARAALGRRTLAPGVAADATLREIERALPRMGWPVGARATLLSVERRLAEAGRPVAARYIGRLRAHRYSNGGMAPPDRSARRALRRELGDGGLRARLRALLALPPWGPRRG